MVKLLEMCKRRPREALTNIEHPHSILDIEGKNPLRFQPLVEAASYLYSSGVRITNLALDSFSRMNNSLADVFCLQQIWEKLKAATFLSVAKDLAPYSLTFLTEQFLESCLGWNNQNSLYLKTSLALVFLGFLMSERITDKSEMKHVALKITYQTVAIWSFVNLHVISYSSGYKFGQDIFLPLEEEKYINSETKDNLSILAAIISTFCLLPQFVLLMAQLIE